MINERTKIVFDFAQKFVVQLITLASGIVALEVGLLKDHPHPEHFRWVAITSWLAFGGSILGGMAAHQFLIGQLDLKRKPTAVPETEITVYDPWIRRTAGAQIILFVVGVIFSIILGWRIVSVVSNPQPPQLVKLNQSKPSVLTTVSSRFVQLVECVGPFDSGRDDHVQTSFSSRVCSSPETIAHNIQDRSKHGVLVLLLLVGSADKFELTTPRRRRYGSNEGLARSRADWLRERLVALHGITNDQVVRVLTLTEGPSAHGQALFPKDTIQDRAVTIFGLWWTAG